MHLPYSVCDEQLSGSLAFSMSERDSILCNTHTPFLITLCKNQTKLTWIYKLKKRLCSLIPEIGKCQFIEKLLFEGKSLIGVSFLL